MADQAVDEFLLGGGLGPVGPDAQPSFGRQAPQRGPGRHVEGAVEHRLHRLSSHDGLQSVRAAVRAAPALPDRGQRPGVRC